MSMLWVAAPRRGLVGPCGSAYVPGNAMTFDGTNDYLTIADNATFDSWGGATVCAVVQLSSKAASMAILSKQDATASGNDMFLLAYDQPNDMFRVRFVNQAGGLSSKLFGGLTPVATATTYFVVGTWDLTNIGISVDDAALETNGLAGTGTNIEAQPFRIGALADASQKWNGAIGAVGLWSRKLTAGEITSVYNAGTMKQYSALSAGEKVGLVSYYNMGEVEGVSTVCDFHAANHLTVVGSPGTVPL